MIGPDRKAADAPTDRRGLWSTFLLAPLPLAAGLVAIALWRDLTATVLAVLLGLVTTIEIGRARVRAGSISERTLALAFLGSALLLLSPFVAVAIWVFINGLPVISDPTR
jgi:hypothetical protein